MRRAEQREWLVKLAYETQASQDAQIEELLSAHELPEESYLLQSLASLFQHCASIDQIIEENLKRWRLERVMRIDLAILRVAVNEMCFTKLAPVRVTINESVELAKRYSDEGSYRFVNGVLSGVAKKMDEEKV